MTVSKIIYGIALCLFSNLVFSQSTDIQKTTMIYKDTLELDFYSSDISQQKKSPLLVLVHGGGFASGKKDGPLESEFSMNMAKHGYPVVSIAYRLTRKNDPFNCDCLTENKIGSFIAGSEDLAAAIQFLENKKELVFNRSSIILIGSSAGAEVILHSAFMNSDYRFKHIPKIQVSGLISLSGAMTNSSYINKQNAVPSLFIHGKKDDLVPFGTAPHHFCSEDRTGYLMLDGPETISNKLKNQQTSYLVAFNKEGNHDWADIGYSYTNLVHDFIQDHILNDKLIQSFMEIQESNTSIGLTDK